MFWSSCKPEPEQHGLLRPLVHDDLAVDHLGDPGLAPVERADRGAHGVVRLRAGQHGREVVTRVPQLRDRRLEVVGSLMESLS